MEERRIYIREAAELLDRVEHTLRTWEYNGMLPPELRPHRDDRNRRYWTPVQLEGIRDWLVSADIRPGKGLPALRAAPPPEHQARHRQRMRRG